MKRSSTAVKTNQERTASTSNVGKNGEICPTCSGTGLVCGVEPSIGPGACCVDYANAVCPACGGRGRKT